MYCAAGRQMLMTPILRLSYVIIIKYRGLGRRARWNYRCGPVHSDAGHGVLSGRGADGVPSAPKPEMGKRMGDIKPTAKAALTGKYGGTKRGMPCLPVRM